MSILLGKSQNCIVSIIAKYGTLTANQICRYLFKDYGITMGTAAVTARIREMPYPFKPSTVHAWNSFLEQNIYRYCG